MDAKRSWEPPRLFSWHVATPDPERGACGVTSERAAAVQGVTAAMHAIGGTSGVIQSCRLSWLGSYYVYGSVVARVERDEVSGARIWRDEPHREGASPSETPPAVREAIDCMPIAQATTGLESPPQTATTVDVADGGGLYRWA